MGKASDNIFPKVQLSTAIASAAPSGGTWRMEARADGIYAISSNTGSGGTGPFSAGASGAVATDAIWDAAGDLVQGTGANTAARLALGAVGTVPTAGASTLAYAYPPGYEYNYVEATAGVSITATTEATAQVITTSASITYDGTPVIVHAFAPFWNANPTAGPIIVLVLWDNTAAASIGKMGVTSGQSTSSGYSVLKAERRLTPASGARIYSIRAYVSGGTGEVAAGAGGVGNYMPGFIRITKV